MVEELYRTYKQDVYGYLLSLTRDPSLAEDLLSETFLKAIQSLPKFRGDSTSKTWLLGIARNVWLQELRRRRKTVEYSDLLEVYVGEGMIDHFLTREAVARVGELLREKEERARRVVALRVDGTPYQEIARELGITENSARVIDFRTKKWLKQTLEKEGLL
ncbi:RNA polymerase sigma factor [Merdimmobilis hominis]|jgi:RNA polymerase sigma factor (sigma-70 family)|uniref:RNA polymerase sigma factor SigM n=1 Tax=uncultured Anaerotruncus sp. TaxID=905011 RepID=A0A6N2S0H3_9FIRM|nr:sigma-70 family RNA polymerase sigma factor [Merdimmobilis hominis]MCD4836458.1 sigma-70 family RNA polymerase sigma factor [Merdimmobilis hominis]PWL63672.1 MAG: sigma-70 family RNA polymerase sigma factor [Oscillospiraceae bacterium]